MEKIEWKPGTMIYPLPAVMVSCGSNQDEYNIITIAWTGTVCTDPPMCYISLRPSRHSYEIIKKNREFVINLTTAELARAADWCGVKSGRDYNKFKEMKLTPAESNKVKAPAIAESPVNIECRLTDIIKLGIHHMFLAEVLSIQADKKYLNTETGAFHLDKASLISYQHGRYYETGSMIGRFGYSVMKKKKKKKRKTKK
ncbi:MAG: flavin reductase family protein [Bacteroidales bacterium]|nr:flavin reductase family protein [Bacteroidales bacterium]